MQNEALTHETPERPAKPGGLDPLNAGAAARSAPEADLVAAPGPAERTPLTTPADPVAGAVTPPANTTPAKVAAIITPRSVIRSPRIWHHFHPAGPVRRPATTAMQVRRMICAARPSGRASASSAPRRRTS